MRLLRSLVATAAAALSRSPRRAQAGTYDVHFCNSTGTVFDNRSWSALASAGHRRRHRPARRPAS